MKRLESIDLKQIQINDDFWNRYVRLVREVIIPYQWDAMNDRIADAEPSHCLDNFAIAAGKKKGRFYGAVFQDTDIAKWLEAVGYSLASAGRDAELEKTADDVIELIAQAQQEDGYLDTYYILQEPGKRWQNLCEGHELYTAGHMMEAAVAYYQATGKRRLLDVVLRLADLICRTFGAEEGKIHGYPGHQEVEIGLIKLYFVTGERRYLEQARYFIDARGVGENYFLQERRRPDFQTIFWGFDDYDPSYSQSHLPVREQKTAEGHAVRAVYMYSAMADLACEYQDAALLDACKTLWNNMVSRRMYLTGGIGSSGILERFTTDYDLPNDCNYAESCASIGLALFGLRMAQITGEASYIDVVERALYNTVLAGIAQDGRSFFYVNPLEVWPESCLPHTSREHIRPRRQKWFGVACCPPNIARTLASLGQYLYARSDDRLYLNLFVSGQVQTPLAGGTAAVRVETRFPLTNSLTIRIEQAPGGVLPLAVRIPDYAERFRIQTDGVDVPYRTEKGYALLEAQEGSTVTIRFDAPPKFVRANPQVRADCGKVALVRGPLVYCLEQIDNGEDLAALYVDAGAAIREVESELFGGSVLLETDGKRMKTEDWGEELYAAHPVVLQDVRLRAVPYAYWNNRGQGEMTVWIKELLR